MATKTVTFDGIYKVTVDQHFTKIKYTRNTQQLNNTQNMYDGY